MNKLGRDGGGAGRGKRMGMEMEVVGMGQDMMELLEVGRWDGGGGKGDTGSSGGGRSRIDLVFSIFLSSTN